MIHTLNFRQLTMALVRPAAILFLASGVLAQGTQQHRVANSVDLESSRIAPTRQLTFEGLVLTPEGAFAEGAVVVSNAGGHAVTDSNGAYCLELAVPSEADSMRISAFGSSGQSLQASVQVPILGVTGTVLSRTLELSLSTSCEPRWLPTFGSLSGTSDDVTAFAVFDDGSGPALYVGGDFNKAGGNYSRNIAKWDGSRWDALQVGLNGPVNALAVFDDGTGEALYVGGEFGFAGEAPTSHMAKWDGTSWSQVGAGLPDLVSALVVYDDGSGAQLYAGGKPNSSLTKWDGTSWSRVGTGSSQPVNGWVNALAVFDDGSGPALFVGGLFSSAGGATASNVAKWDGNAWSSLGSGTNGFVTALAVFDDGSGAGLFVGGNFTAAGGVNANYIAKWDGASWSTLGTGGGVDWAVKALTVFDDGTGDALIVGGFFSTAGGVPMRSIASWDGSNWATLGTGEIGGNVFALTVFDGGAGDALCVGGDFLEVNGAEVNHAASLSGSNWSPLGDALGNGLTAPVGTLQVFDDGSGPALYVGGGVTTHGSQSASGLAKWDGSSWSPVGGGVDGPVIALTVWDDGGGPALYISGGFTSVGGVAARNIAKWDGTSWSALGSGVINAPRAFASFDDGSGPALYVGGFFYEAGGLPANNIAKWDGSSWSTLGTGLTGGFLPDVWDLVVFNDGSGDALFVAGRFSLADAVPTEAIAVWDGSNWSSPAGGGVDPPMGGSESRIFALTLFDDGTGTALYAGGNFITIGGVSVRGIAQWDGNTWAGVGGGVIGTIWTLAVANDGTGPALFAGGHLSSAGPTATPGVAKWDGSNWSSLGSGVTQTEPVFALAGFDDGTGEDVYVGGNFPQAHDSGDSYLARWGREASDCNGNAYCFGYGSGSMCPCSGNGGPGEGCANSGGLGGAELYGDGFPNLTNDSFALYANGVPGSVPCLILQGSQAITSGQVLGDGLLCVSGQTARSQVQVSIAGAVTFTDFQGSPFGASSYGVGVPTNYQLWYRDAANACSGMGFNFSNAWAMTWQY